MKRIIFLAIVFTTLCCSCNKSVGDKDLIGYWIQEGAVTNPGSLAACGGFHFEDNGVVTQLRFINGDEHELLQNANAVFFKKIGNFNWYLQNYGVDIYERSGSDIIIGMGSSEPAYLKLIGEDRILRSGGYGVYVRIKK